MFPALWEAPELHGSEGFEVVLLLILATLALGFTRGNGLADALRALLRGWRLVLNIMTQVSQSEREAIAERTRDAMRHKRHNGEHVGWLT